MGVSQPHPVQPILLSVEGLPPAVERREKLDLLEERLRVVEGFGDFLFADMMDLCLVPDVIIPPKFKVPNFDKYKGTIFPKNHLKMYCRKMGAHSRDEKFLLHFFQDSLSGAAVIWYTNLEASRIRSWKDLITTFIRQYQYNTDMAPDRTQLQNMCKREHESIKEYAQRWRDLAAQVVPPMMERKMITMIVDTLLVFYYEKLVGYMPCSLADLVFMGERIKVGLKRGKCDYASPVGTSNWRVGTTGARKKEGDTHVVTSTPAWPKSQQAPHDTHLYAQHHPSFVACTGSSSPSAPGQPRMPAPPPRVSSPAPALAQSRPNNNFSPSMSYNAGRLLPARRTPEFSLIPMSYEDLLPSLLSNHMAVVTSGRTYQVPFPKWYNPDVTCTNHGGTSWH